MLDVNEVSRTRLMEHVAALAHWTRLSGSSEEREAANYVAAQLKAMGYNARIVEHDAYISLPGEASLRVTSPHPREIFCITHSMAEPTPSDGIAGELIYAGNGTVAELLRAGAAGKFALVEGLATEENFVAAGRAGVKGLICFSGRHAHEMCVSPIWGNPAESTLPAMPKVHMLSVHKEDGEALRQLCQQEPVAVHMTAAVHTQWTRTPITLADLTPEHPEAEVDKFVLFSGHLDSWYVGAMDNGTANATMLEVARLVASNRSELRRGVRLAMWSGHSHGRYSSSAWYADNHWFDLAEHCVVHVNIDSVGGQDADRFASISMPETHSLGAWAVERVAGAKLEGRQVGRIADQSFLGIGIPSLFASLSRQANGSLGWWWHTPHDTIDKVDPDRLLRDAKIYALVLSRLLTEAVLPLDYTASAAYIHQHLASLAQAAGSALDLSAAIAAASCLESLCERLYEAAADAAPPRAINPCLQAMGRILIPVTYTTAGRFAHDPAIDGPFLPKLSAIRRLSTLEPTSDEARFLVVDLIRARNEITDALRRASACVEACL